MRNRARYKKAVREDLRLNDPDEITVEPGHLYKIGEEIVFDHGGLVCEVVGVNRERGTIKVKVVSKNG